MNNFFPTTIEMSKNRAQKLKSCLTKIKRFITYRKYKYSIPEIENVSTKGFKMVGNT